MNEQERAELFSRHVDAVLKGWSPDASNLEPEDEERALLALARELGRLDWSDESAFLARVNGPAGRHAAAPPKRGARPIGDFLMNGGLLNRRSALATVMLALALVVLSVTMIAPVRAFAGEMWQVLFVRHDDSRLPVAGPAIEAGPTATPLPAPDARPQMSVQEAAALVSFAVKEPAQLPPGFALQSVHLDEAREKVTFLYLNSENLGLVLHQEPAASAQPWTIGPDAVIEAVMVGNVPGEYVQGSWRDVEAADAAAEAEWLNEDPHQQLRWTESEITYTLSTTVGRDLGLSQAGLIALAESLQ